MRDKPWAAVPLLNPENPTIWYEKDDDFYLNRRNGSSLPVEGEVYDLQYRPGRKAKVKK